MMSFRYWLNAITWAIWVDLGTPKWLTPVVKFFSDMREKRGEA